MNVLEIIDLLGRQFRESRDRNHVLGLAELALVDLSGNRRFEVAVVTRLLGGMFALRQWQFRNGAPAEVPDQLMKIVIRAVSNILGIPDTVVTPAQERPLPLMGDSRDNALRLANLDVVEAMRVILSDWVGPPAVTEWGGTLRATQHMVDRETGMLGSLTPALPVTAVGEAAV